MIFKGEKMYESPINVITKQISEELSHKADEMIMEAIYEQGVVVDKDELIKAIQYDRDQYEKGYSDGKKELKAFADKIRLHMTRYCFGRLDQQYCAMEVIAYIGRLLGEKDYSIDVEKEMASYDTKIRANAIDDFQEWLKTQIVGVDNKTKEILVVKGDKWELAIDVYKESDKNE